MPPHWNIVGQDPRLADPGQGDYRPLPGSPAEGYGCRTWPTAPGLPAGSRAESAPRSHAPEAPGTATAASSLQATTTATLAANFLIKQRDERRSLIEVGGDIVADTYWDADTVRVLSDVNVFDAVTLGVAPGAHVEFSMGTRLDVQGRVLAQGLPDARIVFTNAAGEDSYWDGIRFEFTPATNAPSLFEFCEFTGALSTVPVSAEREDIFAGRGGAFTVAGYSGLRLANCVLESNRADFGAALYISHYAAPEIVGCLITRNSAYLGGGAVYFMDSHPRFTNCDILANSDLNPEIFDPAAALTSYIAKPWTRNCIIRDNGTNYFLPSQTIETKPFYTIYNDVEDGHEGEGNFDLDPLFLGSGEHPFDIDGDSPCRDAGLPDTLGLHLPLLDLAGRPRLSGLRVDVGCYETPDLSDVPIAAVQRLRLSPAHPNPFNPSTTIRFSLAEAGPVELSIHDLRGRRVATLYSGQTEAGEHNVVWRGRDDAGRALPSGVYLARLAGGGKILSSKLMLLK